MSDQRSDGFIPLQSYAALGDLRAAALVARDGAVDWLAASRLDAAPVCAGLLDPGRGGSIILSLNAPYEVSRRYIPGTMVLESTFVTDTGTVRITDALNLGSLGTLPWTELARLVEVDAGTVSLSWTVAPGQGLAAAASPWAHPGPGAPMVLVGESHLAIVLDALGEPTAGDGRVSGRAELHEGQSGLLAVLGTRGEPVSVPSAADIRQRVGHTIETWQRWSELITYRGRWKEPVARSALALKSLTLKSTGAIAAAATTSLPEQPGGKRNFDYRYAWVRDAAFSLDAMSRLGLSEELHAGISWLLAAVAQEAPEIRVFYDLDGKPASAQMTKVDNVPGYRHSRPVNVGNGAASQLQLGAYGHLLDAVCHYTARGGVLDASNATMLAGIADHVCDIWMSPDAGLWELGTPEHYTSSKLGAWLALDRAAHLAKDRQIHHPHAARWRDAQSRIRAYVDERCWSEGKRAYSFYADSDELDAAVLLMARFGFCEPGDTRLAATIEAITAELDAGDGLLYRYSGQRDQEGAFLACSGWMVEALVHVGRLADAQRVLTRFLDCANDVGLLSEEIDPHSMDLLGNLPQALTHLALINAVTTLDAALETGPRD